MIRGTTPEYTFTLPFETELIETGRISFAQDGRLILQKTMDDCVLEAQSITLKLTQEETFRFDSNGGYAEIQIRILTTGGDALASELLYDTVEPTLDSEVLT